jgi:hypothetical protein
MITANITSLPAARRPGTITIQKDMEYTKYDALQDAATNISKSNSIYDPPFASEILETDSLSQPTLLSLAAPALNIS